MHCPLCPLELDNNLAYPRVCGGTLPNHKLLLRLEVYPRVCGGTLLPLPRRSIPACAGEPRQGAIEVYPRVCGGSTSWPCTRRREVYPRVCGGTVRVTV